MAGPIVGNPVFAQTNAALPGGTSIGVHIETPNAGQMFFVAPGGTVDVPVEGTADVASGNPVPNTTIIYVIDTSGSTTSPSGSETCGNQNPGDDTPGFFDSDGDDILDTPFPSLANEVIDCEILALKNLNAMAIELGHQLSEKELETKNNPRDIEVMARGQGN